MQSVSRTTRTTSYKLLDRDARGKNVKAEEDQRSFLLQIPKIISKTVIVWVSTGTLTGSKYRYDSCSVEKKP